MTTVNGTCYTCTVSLIFLGCYSTLLPTSLLRLFGISAINTFTRNSPFKVLTVNLLPFPTTSPCTLMRVRVMVSVRDSVRHSSVSTVLLYQSLHFNLDLSVLTRSDKQLLVIECIIKLTRSVVITAADKWVWKWKCLVLVLKRKCLVGICPFSRSEHT